MNTKNLASLMAFKNLKTVKVVFGEIGTKEYTYKTWLNDLQFGDHCVVDANGKYKVCLVISVDPVCDLTKEDIDYKWIIQKLNLGTLNEVLKREQHMREILMKKEQQTLVDNAVQLFLDEHSMSQLDIDNLTWELEDNGEKEEKEK